MWGVMDKMNAKQNRKKKPMEKVLKLALEDLVKLTLALEPSTFTETAVKCSYSTLSRISSNSFNEAQLDKNLKPFLWFLKIEDVEIAVKTLEYLSSFFTYLNTSGNYETDKFCQANILDEIVSLGCNCYKFNSSAVHNSLITLLINWSCQENYHNGYILHKNHLVLTLRTLIRVHILSTDRNIQVTAKDAISTIVTTVFKRYIDLRNEKFILRTSFYKPILQQVLSSLLTYGKQPFELNGNMYSQVFCSPGLNMKTVVSATPSYISIYLRDSLLVFRTLSKVTLKDNRKIEDHEHEIKARYLALDLLTKLLRKYGKEIMTDKNFLHILQKYVCAGLVKNLLQPRTHLFTKALEVACAFSSDALSIELSFLINDVLLILLESKVCPVKHKILVVDTFHKLLAQPDILLKMFVENDCSLGKQNVFERLISSLTAITCKTINYEAQKHFEQKETSAAYEIVADIRTLHKSCIDLVSTLLKSMNLIVLQNKYQGRPASSAETQFDGKRSPTQNFNRKQKEKYDLAEASAKFTLKPKLGIAYLIDQGYISKDDTTNARDIAKTLFQYSEKLSKTQIGEYLGNEKPKQIEVMTCYVELFNFENLDFDMALRRFLSKFRLPGEAQKIDRLMEKFAAVYCEQNPDLFPTSDTAFILAYSIIMLNTDAHNPNIKPDKKMKKNEFINLNRGIAGGRDLDKDFLQMLYDNITQNAITLKEDDEKRNRRALTEKSYSTLPRFFSSSASLTEEERNEIQYNKQIAELACDLQAKLSIELHASTISQETLEGSEDIEYVALMLTTMHTSLCAIFSLNLEVNSDLTLIQNSVSMFSLGLRLMNRLANKQTLANNEEVREIRDSQLNLLTQSCHLNKHRPLSNKDLICIGELTRLICKDFETLSTSWTQAVMHLSNLVEFDVSREGELNLDTYYAQNTIKIGNVVKFDSIDRVFMSTPNLSDIDLCLFFKALKTVSYIELSVDESRLSQDDSFDKTKLIVSPFTQEETSFCLQKIIEVAEINLEKRPRLLWAQIWSGLYDFFVITANHKNEKVSLFVLDSLRQLSLKFIVKDEHIGFNFQAQFLKPFELIFKKSRNQKKLIYILDCLQYLLKAKGENIKSGWKVYLDVLCVSTMLGNDLTTAEYAQLMQVSSNLLTIICDSYLPQMFFNSATLISLLECIDYFLWLNFAGSIHLRQLCIEKFYPKALAHGINHKQLDVKLQVISHFVKLFNFPQKNHRISLIRLLTHQLLKQREQLSNETATSILCSYILPLFSKHIFNCNALTEASYILAKSININEEPNPLAIESSILFDINVHENYTTFSELLSNITPFALSFGVELADTWINFLLLLFSNQPLTFFKGTTGLALPRAVESACLKVLSVLFENSDIEKSERGVLLASKLLQITFPTVISCFGLKGDTFMLSSRLGELGYIDSYDEAVVFYLSDFNLSLLRSFTKEVLKQINKAVAINLAESLLQVATKALNFNKRLKLRILLEEEGFLTTNHYSVRKAENVWALRRNSTASVKSNFSSVSNIGSEIKVASVLEEMNICLPPGLFKQELATYKALVLLFTSKSELVTEKAFREIVSKMFLRFIKCDKYVYAFCNQVYGEDDESVNILEIKNKLSAIKYKESRLIKKKLLPLVIDILRLLLTLDKAIVKNLNWFYTEATNLVQVENRDVRALVSPLLSIFNK